MSDATPPLPRGILIWLSLATFAVGIDGFVIAGLLPQIGDDVGVGPGAAGQLITAFSVTFALAEPTLGALTAGWDRRRVLLTAFTVFVLGNLLTAVADTYPALLASRIVAGLGAAQITSSSASVATALVAPAQRGRALALVMGGLISASAIGVPIGLVLGLASWRATMVLVATVGIAAAAGVAARLPKVSLPAVSLGARLRPLRSPAVLAITAVTTLFLSATYGVVAYQTFALHAAGLSRGWTVAALTAFGLSAVVANNLAGRLVDRTTPARVTGLVLGATVALCLVGPVAMTGPVTAFVWTASFGLCGGAITVPQQSRLVELDPPAAPVLLGLNSSSIYAGQALGGVLGAAVLAVAPVHTLGWAAVAVLIVAAAVHLARERAVPAAPAPVSACPE